MHTSSSYQKKLKWRFSLKWRNGCDLMQPYDGPVFENALASSSHQSESSISTSHSTDSIHLPLSQPHSQPSPPPLSSSSSSSSSSSYFSSSKNTSGSKITSSPSPKLSWANAISKNALKNTSKNSQSNTSSATTPSTEEPAPTSNAPTPVFPSPATILEPSPLHTLAPISFQMEDTVLPAAVPALSAPFPLPSSPFSSPTLAPAAVSASNSVISCYSASTAMETTLTEPIRAPPTADVPSMNPTKADDHAATLLSPPPPTLPTSPPSSSPPLMWSLAVQKPKHTMAVAVPTSVSSTPTPLRLNSKLGTLPDKKKKKVHATTGCKPVSHEKQPSSVSMSSGKSLTSFLATYALDFQPRPLALRGLVNQGNLCFLNVILQPLIHCIPFFNLIQAIHKEVHLDPATTPLLHAFVQLFDEFGSHHLYDTRIPVSPEPIYLYLETKLPQCFVRGRQEDAEEFLGYLLDGLHTEFLAALPSSVSTTNTRTGDASWLDPVNEPRGAPPSCPWESTDIHRHHHPHTNNNNNNNGTSDDDEGWHVVNHHRKVASTRSVRVQSTPITALFSGRMQSRFKPHGAKASLVSEPFQTLPLDIHPDAVHTLMDALLYTVHSEHPVGPTSGTKQHRFESVPVVFVFQLKRFYFDVAKQVPVKLCKPIAVPFHFHLDPARFLVHPHTWVPMYRLFGIVYHHGATALGGHYTCDVVPTTERLVRMDDTEWASVALSAAGGGLVLPAFPAPAVASAAGAGGGVSATAAGARRAATLAGDGVSEGGAKESECVPYLLFYELVQLVQRPETFLGDTKQAQGAQLGRRGKKKG